MAMTFAVVPANADNTPTGPDDPGCISDQTDAVCMGGHGACPPHHRASVAPWTLAKGYVRAVRMTRRHHLHPRHRQWVPSAVWPAAWVWAAWGTY